MRLPWLFFRSLRPKQWVKNLFIFAPMIFSLRFFHPGTVWRATLAFLLFGLVTGSIYVINDCIDRDRDRFHPRKRTRPIASGALGVKPALAGAVLLLALAMVLVFHFDRGFFLLGLIYVLMNLLYSIILKRIVILDVMVIAFGFVLRVMIGGVIDDIPLSPWILIITFLGSLFLALIKRRQEMIKLNRPGEAETTRTSLKSYNLPLLDQLISVTTATTLISYIMYVVNPGIQMKFHTQKLYFTIPFLVFGLFRYLYLTYIQEKGESPEEVLFTDLPFTLNLLVWLLVFVLLIVYQ